MMFILLQIARNYEVVVVVKLLFTVSNYFHYADI